MDLKVLKDTPPWEWPSQAGRMFHQVLNDKKSSLSDRLIAADLAGDSTVINDVLATALLKIVGGVDEPEELRAAAAISLGPVLDDANTLGFDDPEDLPITEQTFDCIKLALHKLYLDDGIPKEVRRRILEAAVRAPLDWHREAIAQAYAGGDRDWVLTAVFAMQYVRGFDGWILESLDSEDPDIQREAVMAAGAWSIDEAWPHIAALVTNKATPKSLLLAAIGASAEIRPQEAADTLDDLTESDDEEIADAATEAIDEATASEEFEDEEDNEFF